MMRVGTNPFGDQQNRSVLSSTWAKEAHTITMDANKIRASFEFDGRRIEFNVTGRSAILNAQMDGQAVQINGIGAAKGFMSAFADAFRFKRYPVLESGLHLKQTLEELRRKQYANNVGYLTSAYDGENSRLLALRPESGVVQLGFMGGRFVSEQRSPDAGPAPEKGEADWITKNRRVFYKHTAMDALINGVKAQVSPFFKKEGEDGLKMYDGEHVENLFNVWVASYEMSDEEAMASRNERLSNRLLNKAMAQSFAKAEAGAAVGEGILTVKLADGGEIAVADLVGKVVQYHYESGLKVGGVRLVKPEHLGVVLETIRTKSLLVSVQDAA